MIWLRLCALALVLLCACAEDPPPEPTARFTPRPAHVQASSLLPDECLLALADAVAFWRGMDVAMSLAVVDPGATSQLGIAVIGVIAVLPGKLATWPKLVHGETSYFHSIGGDILAAEIVPASCNTRVVAHEIGHALGLVDVEAPWNLMHSELSLGGWLLTEDQRAWVDDVSLGEIVEPAR